MKSETNIEFVDRVFGKLHDPSTTNWDYEELKELRDRLLAADAKLNQAILDKPPSDPLDTPLPCDIELRGMKIRKGCSLGTLVDAANRWRDAALDAINSQPPQQEIAKEKLNEPVEALGSSIDQTIFMNGEHWIRYDQCLKAMRARVPDGYVIVPKEPTVGMYDDFNAGRKAYLKEHPDDSFGGFQGGYAALLAAAPKPE